MLIKIVIVGLLAFMIYNLFRALFIMNKNDPNQPKMSAYIGRRVMTLRCHCVITIGWFAYWGYNTKPSSLLTEQIS